MKLLTFSTYCNEIESKEICEIINEFDLYRSTYIKVDYIEFSKKTTSKRAYVGAPMLQVESNCVKINGLSEGYSEISNGTRYVYEGDKLYTEIYKWYLRKSRDQKLGEILK